jgi:hypothetical protein
MMVQQVQLVQQLQGQVLVFQQQEPLVLVEELVLQPGQQLQEPKHLRYLRSLQALRLLEQSDQRPRQSSAIHQQLVMESRYQLCQLKLRGAVHQLRCDRPLP